MLNEWNPQGPCVVDSSASFQAVRGNKAKPLCSTHMAAVFSWQPTAAGHRQNKPWPPGVGVTASLLNSCTLEQAYCLARKHFNCPLSGSRCTRDAASMDGQPVCRAYCLGAINLQIASLQIYAWISDITPQVALFLIIIIFKEAPWINRVTCLGSFSQMCRYLLAEEEIEIYRDWVEERSSMMSGFLSLPVEAGIMVTHVARELLLSLWHYFSGEKGGLTGTG